MIKILKKVSLKQPVFIACWPGMGEVAMRAGVFLKEALKMSLFARIENTGFFQPQGVVVSRGIVSIPLIEEGAFYYYKPSGREKDIVLFIAEAQPPMDKVFQMSKLIVNFAVSLKVSRIFTFAAFPRAIEHTQDSGVWVSATDKQVLAEFSKYRVKVLSDGQISGLNGLILGTAKGQKIKGACLLGEIPLYTIQIENPKASLSLLKLLAHYLKIDINFKPLEERKDFLSKEIDKLVSFLKGELPPPQEMLPLSEDDIRAMKRELEKLGKLPESVRLKIEDLFKRSLRDVSAASELKKVLDEWNVYKDYEDRFLNLFKKKHTDH